MKRRTPPPLGQRFGRLIVTGVDDSLARRRWRLECDCGGSANAMPSDVRRGSVQSCGCQKAEAVSARRFRHGMSESLEFNTWRGMVERCTRPAHKDWHRYGGRGIEVCARWREGEDQKTGFQCFLEDMGLKPSPAHTIEREDNDKGYSLGNCRWATLPEQMINQAKSLSLTLGGQTQHISEWCKTFGLNVPMVKRRLRLGWSVEEALTTPQLRNNLRKLK